MENKTARVRRKKTRGNGQGCAFKMANGKWRVEVTLGYEQLSNGKKKRIYRSKSGFRTKREALAYIETLRNAKPENERKNVTFKQLYDMWFPTHNRSKSTMDCYQAAMNYYKPIWHLPVQDIDIDDLQECLDECEQGRRTKENMKALANLLYKYGIPRHYIRENLNLAPYLVIRDNSDEINKTAITDDDLEKLKRKLGKVPYADYVYAQCYLGFRPSEFLALDVQDYNATEKAFVGGAKTEAGKGRAVTVSPKIQPIIDRLVSGKTSGPVFCDADGGPITIKTYRAIFYDVLDQCGIDNPTIVIDGKTFHLKTPHSCRRTFATLMKRVDGNDKDKLELIGHTSGKMLRHYQGVSFTDLRKITDVL